MNKLSISTIIALMSISAFADYNDKAGPAAVVEKMSGEVYLGDQQLGQNQKIFAPGMLTTKAKSFVKIRVPAWDASVTVGPNSKMELNFEKKDEANYTLSSGICRWVSDQGSEHTGEQVKTKTAAFGVRGTDFMAKYAKTGETEIIVLDGKVEFRSQLDKNSKQMVNKGQWGGVGGKFGKKVAPPVTAPESAIAAWKKDVD